ncbi:hypothetical protein BASA50_007984 [Batrachochytrium salamandrivorans]|uniref:Uncharacterized protein n=1 Tax=Batrachochytrium salamandrivorans TaxID=1357716 RepID=A0ABQ8F5H7_9FUNG|nr:hypothetical protein BASA50_007984 [Batrachochytrium salamandrivorans]
MKLISFAMVSLLAITVSAQPPHNPDTDAMDQSQNDAIQNMEQSQDISIQDVQGLLEAFFQNLQQLPDADTQNAHQSLGATSQDTHQNQGISSQSTQHSLGATSQDTHQNQDADVQMLEQLLDSITQNMHQPQGISAQDIFSQEIQKFLDSDAQGMHQNQGNSGQNLQQPQQSDIQMSDQPLGNSGQNMHQPLANAGLNIKIYQQKEVQFKINRLTKTCHSRKHDLSQTNGHVNVEKERGTEVRDTIDKIVGKLRETGLSSDKKLRLEKIIYDLRILFDEFADRHMKQIQHYINAMARSNDANAELELLKKNRKLMTEHNSNHEAQVELSPNFFYNVDILKIQYAKILKDIEDSLVEQKTIDNAMRVSDDDALKVQSAQIAYKIQVLKSHSRVARGILWEHRFQTVEIGGTD